MFAIDEIISEAQSMREEFEERWCLPNACERTRDPIWSHSLLSRMAAFDDAGVTHVTAALLEDQSFALRGIALYFIAQRRLAEPMDRVRARYREDVSVPVRVLAANALGSVTCEENLETLLDTMDSDHAEVKKAVVDALHSFKEAQSIPLLARWVGKIGEDDELRRKSCATLGEIGDHAAMPALQRVLKESAFSDAVMGEAAWATARIGGDEAVKVLRLALTTDRPSLKVRILQALALIPNPSLAADYCSCLHPDQDQSVRLAALNGLELLASDEAMPFLEKLVTDEDEQLKTALPSALVACSANKARPALISLMKSDQPQPVRFAAYHSWNRLQGDHQTEGETHDVEGHIAQVLAQAQGAS